MTRALNLERRRWYNTYAVLSGRVLVEHECAARQGLLKEIKRWKP